MKQNLVTERVRTAKLLISGLLLSGLFVLASCNGSSDTSSTSDSTKVDMKDSASSKMGKLEPKGKDPEWGPSIKDEMLVVIEKLQSYGAPPLET